MNGTFRNIRVKQPHTMHETKDMPRIQIQVQNLTTSGFLLFLGSFLEYSALLNLSKQKYRSELKFLTGRFIFFSKNSRHRY